MLARLGRVLYYAGLLGTIALAWVAYSNGKLADPTIVLIMLIGCPLSLGWICWYVLDGDRADYWPT